MFCLADMMTYVEIGASLARKAVGIGHNNDSQSRKILTASRIFAAEVADLVYRNMLKILMGNGLFNQEDVLSILESISCQHLSFAWIKSTQDMDQISAIIFQKEK
jgi:alkylation response protein AidB-like acyl-CoA dehydrogenase